MRFPQVTVFDIQELFGDIGGLLSAVIVKPGVAEVVYKTVKDAEDAVEVYHNRQLDGQPMKCHLITPPPTTLPEPSSASISARAGSLSTSQLSFPDQAPVPSEAYSASLLPVPAPRK